MGVVTTAPPVYMTAPAFEMPGQVVQYGGGIPTGMVTYGTPTTVTAEPMAGQVVMQSAPGTVQDMQPQMMPQVMHAPVTYAAAPAMGGSSVFDQIDRNHDGVISRSEFGPALNPSA